MVLMWHPLQAQTDSLDAFDSSTVMNEIGIYKSYAEYVSGSPSSTVAAEVKLFRVSRKDTLVIAAKVSGISELKKAWGFTNGTYTFVRFKHRLIGQRFWRLQCAGKNPYFYYREKTIVAAGPGLVPLATLALSAAIPMQYILMLINKSGAVRPATIRQIKKLFADQPAILEKFKTTRYSEANSMALIREYNGVE